MYQVPGNRQSILVQAIPVPTGVIPGQFREKQLQQQTSTGLRQVLSPRYNAAFWFHCEGVVAKTRLAQRGL